MYQLSFSFALANIYIGIGKEDKWSMTHSLRYKTSQYLLGTLDTQGEYLWRDVFPGLSVNIGHYTVNYMGRELEMPPKEIELLHFLASHPGMVFTREQLLEQVWGYEGFYGDIRNVDVTVCRLREKIEEDDANPVYILTKWGVGYYLKG